MTRRALVAWGATESNATPLAEAVRAAEGAGNLICGLYYLESYCLQLGSGRVRGDAEPVVTQPRPGAVAVDARFGFAQPAFLAGLPRAVSAARELGTAALAISHSHTCTAMGYFTTQIAEAGLIGIGATNAPACVSPPGGRTAVLGTNPISMAVPARDGGVAMVFDQSTSAIAIGKIRVAAARGDAIPAGWAVDAQGQPTQDAQAALGGSLVSAGGYKGFGFGLMAELLAAAATGSLSSMSAPPLKATEGPAHDLGQFYFLLDPTVFAGGVFHDQLDALASAVNDQPGARLPGSSRKPVSSVNVEASVWQRALELTEGPTAV